MKSKLERFESKTDKTSSPNGCWLWLGCILPCGYGQFRNGSFRVVSHRYAYELYKGEIPEGIFVCHTCDVRNCVNPEHLFLGTQKDNIRDCVNKGRFSFNLVPPSRKLDLKTTKEIKEEIARRTHYKKIMLMFGISQSTISLVRNNKYFAAREENDLDKD